VISTLVHSGIREKYETPYYQRAPIEKYKNAYNEWPVIED